MANFSTFTIADDQTAEPFSVPSSGNKKKQQGTFKASPLLHKHKVKNTALDSEFNTHKENIPDEGTINHSIAVITVNPEIWAAHKKTKKEEDVSEQFVKRFNTHIGNKKNQEKAQRLILKMQQLGGIISSPEDHDMKIDIPAARLGLSVLAGLNHPHLKMDALNNLLVLLQNDKLEKETSHNLVSLAIHLMKQMNRELMQAETLDVQIKITQIYSLVAELLQRHYAQKHINAITKELKIELINTIKALEAINSQEDQQLYYYSKLALEGVRRLVDDNKELFDLIERFYHGFMAVIVLQKSQIPRVFQELTSTFKDLDPHLSNAWYNGVLILNELLKEAKTDLDKLTCLQILIREKRKSFNWKFTYAALEALSELSLHGETPKIRERAFQGIKALGPDFPGLATFADEQELSKHIDLAPVVHLKKPQRKNPNLIIRRSCAEHLAKIAIESNDEIIRKKARLLLIKRLQLEKNQTIQDYLTKIVPASKEEQDEWVKSTL